MSLRANNWIGIDLGTYNSSAAIKSKQGTLEIIKSTGEKTKSKVPFFSHQEKYKEFPSFISFNKDGSFTAYFGSVEQCGDVNNRLDTVDGFNYLMRVYKATMEKLPAYEANFPELEEVKK